MRPSGFSPLARTLLLALPLAASALIAMPVLAVAGPATPLKTDPPNYPPEAARRGTEGFVEVEIVIGADGKVSSVNVLKAQPARVFEREALAAVRRWTFNPATEGGAPVESRVRRKIEFKL
ncbi:MAG: energy transducer TonB [Xanthomonadales bacterium]|nr:energy transducer TonB [Xanthomonadales bacterium]